MYQKIKQKRNKCVVKKDSQSLSSKWNAISFGGKLFLFSPLLMLLVYRILSDTVSVRYFLALYGILGVFLYFIVKRLLTNKSLLTFDLWGYPGSFFISISLFACLNYLTLNSTPKIKIVTLKSKTITSHRSKSYWISFFHAGRIQRFTISKDLWMSIYETDVIKMHYQQSKFGFDIVSRFDK